MNEEFVLKVAEASCGDTIKELILRHMFAREMLELGRTAPASTPLPVLFQADPEILQERLQHHFTTTVPIPPMEEDIPPKLPEREELPLPAPQPVEIIPNGKTEETAPAAPSFSLATQPKPRRRPRDLRSPKISPHADKVLATGLPSKLRFEDMIPGGEVNHNGEVYVTLLQAAKILGQSLNLTKDMARKWDGLPHPTMRRELIYPKRQVLAHL